MDDSTRVYCKDCGWRGKESQLSLINGFEYCPACGSDEIFDDFSDDEED